MPPLAERRHEASLEVDVREAQAHELAHTKAGGVHEAEHRGLRHPVSRADIRGGQEALDLVEREHARELARQLGAIDEHRRVLGHGPLAHEEAKEPA